MNTIIKQNKEENNLSYDEIEYLEFVSYQQEKLENKELELEAVIYSAGMVV